LENVNGPDIGFVTFKSDGKDKDSSFLCYGEETGKNKNKVLFISKCCNNNKFTPFIQLR